MDVQHAKHIVVVGGGISGIAAALTLSQQRSDLNVTLLEASHRLGGILETIHDGPYLVERSADNFATLIPDALQLTQQWGLEDDLIRPNAANRQAFVLNRGRLLPIPAGFSLMQPTRIGSILSTKTLSWKGKLRLLKEFWVAARKDTDDESLESFATRRLGTEVYENLVEPIVSGIFTADPSTLSIQATMPQFAEMERQHGGLIRGHLSAKRSDAAAVARKASGARYDQFMAPRAGMSDWINKLAGQLPSGCIRLSTPVQGLAKDAKNACWEVDTGSSTIRADGVVLASPAAATAKLLTSCIPQAAEIVDGIPYASSAVVAMIVNKADITGRIDGFGMIIPSKEQRRALAISYTSNKYPGRVPDDEILLRVFLGGAMRPEDADLPEGELYDLAQRELREVLGWNGKQANWQRIVRWPNAMPQYLVGHVQRMQKLEKLMASDPTIKLCGAGYHGVGIPQCVRGARKAARELLEVVHGVESQ